MITFRGVTQSELSTFINILPQTNPINFGEIFLFLYLTGGVLPEDCVSGVTE